MYGVILVCENNKDHEFNLGLTNIRFLCREQCSIYVKLATLPDSFYLSDPRNFFVVSKGTLGSKKNTVGRNFFFQSQLREYLGM
jgi:hypothetical protein